jgi:hypothetical protein
MRCFIQPFRELQNPLKSLIREISPQLGERLGEVVQKIRSRGVVSFQKRVSLVQNALILLQGLEVLDILGRNHPVQIRASRRGFIADQIVIGGIENDRVKTELEVSKPLAEVLGRALVSLSVDKCRLTRALARRFD